MTIHAERAPRLARLLPLVLAAGLLGCPKIEDENTPIALVVTPASPARGPEVTLSYRLRNRNTASVRVAVTYGPLSPRGTATQGSGGEGTTNLTATPGGATHTFVWDALADIGAGFHPDVDLQVTPSLGSRTGTRATTFRFAVDCTDIFRPVAPADPGGPRIAPALSLLPDGRILIIGGADPAGFPLDSVAVWDPADDTYAVADPLLVARYGAAAAPLADGRVLVAGGVGSAGILDSTETYDPRADAWSAGPTLASPRSGHRAALLAGGDVVIVGGRDATGPLATLERFRAGPDTLDLPVALLAPRFLPVVAPLESGLVLIAGGFIDTAGTPTALAETFDPSTDSSSPTGNLQAARGDAATARLDSGDVVVAGGVDSLGVRGDVEIYDVGLAVFRTLLDAGGTPVALATPRRGAVALPLPDDRAAVVGGTDGTSSLADAEIVTASPAGIVLPGNGSLPAARGGPVAALLTSGRAVVLGGDGADEYVAPHRSGTQSFDAVGATPAGRVLASAVRLRDGRVLIVGGRGDPLLDPLADAVIFDPDGALGAGSFAPTVQTGTATETFPQVARQGAAAALLQDGRVLIAGGRIAGGTVTGAAEVFDPQTGDFTATGSLTTPRAGATATLLSDGRVLVAGGTDGATPLASAETYDPTTSLFTAVADPLDAAREGHTATALPDGRVILAGGTGVGGLPIASGELFTPSAATFAGFALSAARRFHGAALLSTGEVLLVGGEDAAGVPLSSTDRIDPAGPTASAGQNLSFARRSPAVAAFDGGQRVLVAGGEDAQGLRSDAEVFFASFAAPAGGSPAIPRRAETLAVALADGRVLLLGGRTDDGRPIAGAEVFQP